MMGLNKTRRRNKGGSGLFPISIQSMRDSNVKVFILMKIQADLLLAYRKSSHYLFTIVNTQKKGNF